MTSAAVTLRARSISVTGMGVTVQGGHVWGVLPLELLWAEQLQQDGVILDVEGW